jgi:hypothetical protein
VDAIFLIADLKLQMGLPGAYVASTKETFGVTKWCYIGCSTQHFSFISGDLLWLTLPLTTEPFGSKFVSQSTSSPDTAHSFESTCKHRFVLKPNACLSDLPATGSTSLPVKHWVLLHPHQHRLFPRRKSDCTLWLNRDDPPAVPEVQMPLQGKSNKQKVETLDDLFLYSKALNPERASSTFTEVKKVVGEFKSLIKVVEIHAIERSHLIQFRDFFIRKQLAHGIL